MSLFYDLDRLNVIRVLSSLLKQITLSPTKTIPFSDIARDGEYIVPLQRFYIHNYWRRFFKDVTEIVRDKSSDTIKEGIITDSNWKKFLIEDTPIGEFRLYGRLVMLTHVLRTDGCPLMSTVGLVERNVSLNADPNSVPVSYKEWSLKNPNIPIQQPSSNLIPNDSTSTSTYSLQVRPVEKYKDSIIEESKKLYEDNNKKIEKEAIEASIDSAQEDMKRFIANAEQIKAERMSTSSILGPMNHMDHMDDLDDSWYEYDFGHVYSDDEYNICEDFYTTDPDIEQ